MESGIHSRHAQQFACEMSQLLWGFEVAEDHSYLLCLQGKEWTHSKRRPEQRRRVGDDAAVRRMRARIRE